jgi:hypothetical protein
MLSGGKLRSYPMVRDSNVHNDRPVGGIKKTWQVK